ncbi:Metal-dependent hydrolase, beta-lactamase superfamily II [Carnobacterium iners]|uniref:Metal-dependent hydrolase, beta-lactamase superfamily II n=1 Tax=Carnobacterium iners TaxID=1073423 RepID=A0A1X7MQD8_9LACT|nr:MBL fold metallo-hydrolase [Carnobacterium iners]SEL09217.1 Metal-dependent hydrolase, beta-lactamase superfamily II [Carnobacterium iners]SMH26561.1 Metal-dependent hydrolase, beta-lactamase superfamily II [Carnobacterium iners]
MKKIRIVSLILLFALFFTGIKEVTAASYVNVHFLNVGQGDAVLVQTPNENILIDGGGKGKGPQIVSYLKKNKVTTLSAVVSTHPDADHVGGLAYVIKTVKVNKVYAPNISHTTSAYKDFLLAVKSKNMKITVAKLGVEIPTQAKDITLKFLGPVRVYGKSDLNNWSGVLHLKHNKKSFLFMGDAENAAESDLLAKKLISKVDVLKVGHHGSKYSTSAKFLEKTVPTYSVLSVGKNGYGHPTSDVLNRLKKVRSNVHRTDKSGNIVFSSNGIKITPRMVR